VTLIVEYIYTATIESLQKLTEDQLLALSKYAQVFELKELIQLCSSFAKSEGKQTDEII
jgi:hypothetical protein